jgi:hypothetical protein
VFEQIERTEHLLTLIDDKQLDWRPAAEVFTMGELLGHLLESVAGFCAVLFALNREELSHFDRLRELPVNHRRTPGEATAQLRQYRSYLEEGFGLLKDQDLTRQIPTMFVPQGETALTLLLGNLEHLINHKHQLFFYLKLSGIEVSSPDLYRFRGV